MEKHSSVPSSESSLLQRDLAMLRDEDPKETLKLLKKYRLYLLERLRSIQRLEQELRKSLDVPPPTPLDQSLALEVAVLSGSEGESEFAPLNPKFADHVLEELSNLVNAVYKSRQDTWRAVGGSDDHLLACQQGFSDAETMQHTTVLAVVSDLFDSYLSSEDHLRLSLSDIARRLDEHVFPQHDAFPLPKETNAEPPAPLLAFITQVTMQICQDIIEDQVKSTNEENLKNQDAFKPLTPELYVQQYLSFPTLEAFLRQIVSELVRYACGPYAKSGWVALEVRDIRHSCRNQLNTHALKASLDEVEKLKLRNPDILSTKTLIDRSVLDQYIAIAVKEKTASRGKKIHKILPVDDLSFINDVTVRLAGTDQDGRPVASLEEDIDKFQRTELPFTEWSDPLRQREHDADLTEEEERGLQTFHTRGGHISRLPRSKIEYIMRHGIVVFLETKIRDNVSIVLGTVSAMTRTPCTAADTSTVDPVLDWEHEAAGSQWFPQYDLRNLLLNFLSEQEQNQMYETAKKRLLICRSSIHDVLNEDRLREELQGQALPHSLQQRPLRRLGLAARGKYEIFMIARSLGLKWLTFNIGTVKQAGEMGLSMGNTASQEHNSWTQVLTWRNYVDRIKEGVNMYWAAHHGTIEEGMREFEREGGLLKGKGYEMDKAQMSGMRNLERLINQIGDGKHAPY